MILIDQNQRVQQPGTGRLGAPVQDKTPWRAPTPQPGPRRFKASVHRAKALSQRLWEGAGRSAGVGLTVLTFSMGAQAVAQPLLGAPLSGDPMLETPVGAELEAVSEGLALALAAVHIDGAELRQGHGRAELSAELDAPLELGGMSLQAGTRVNFQFSDHGANLNFHPGAQLQIGWLESQTVRSLRLDFQSGRVEPRVEGMTSVDPYVGMLGVGATALLSPYLPEAMRTPGYLPSQDPDLQQNLQLLVDRMLGRGTPANAPELPGLELSALGLDTSFTIVEDKQIPIPGNDRSLWVKAGTRVSIDLDTEGSAEAPELRALRLRFDEPVGVSSKEDAVFNRMDLHGITIHPGAQISLSYELGPEQVIDTTRTLLVLLALLAEPQAADRLPPIAPSRMDGLREDVQTMIDQELEPQLIQLIGQLDPQIPQVSLQRFFGL